MGLPRYGKERAVSPRRGGSSPPRTSQAHGGSEHVVLQFQESNLQTFPPTEGRGRVTGSVKPPSDADDTFSKPGPGQGASGSQQDQSWQGYFSPVSYRPYFDVDTKDVLSRIRDSIIPFRGDFVEKTSPNPDMYGPFWICTTLIFVTAALGNLAAYLATKTGPHGSTRWQYNINRVSESAALYYGYVGVIPVALHFLLRYLGVASSLVQLWCLYGYSLFIFIPALFLSIVPHDIFRWAVVAVAGITSALFLALNLRSFIKTASERWFLIVAGSAAIQLVLALVLKLEFFTIDITHTAA